MLLVKLIVLLLLGFVVISLFSALFFMIKDRGQTNRTVNALSVRIGLSILAIVVIMIAGATGVIELNPSPLSATDRAAEGLAGNVDGEPAREGSRGEDPGGGRRLATPND